MKLSKNYTVRAGQGGTSRGERGGVTGQNRMGGKWLLVVGF